MKKLIGKRQTDSHPDAKPLRRSPEVVPKLAKEKKPFEKFYKSMQTKSLDNRRPQSKMSEGPSNLDLHYNNPNFSKHDSLSIEASTSQSCFQDFSNQNENEVNRFVDVGDSTLAKEAGFQKSKSASERNMDSRSLSEEAIDQLGENFLLKKTDEKTNFSFNSFDVNFINDSDLQEINRIINSEKTLRALKMTDYSFSVPEKLALTDETSNDESTVNALFNESLPNIINLKRSQGDKSKKKDRKLPCSRSLQKKKEKLEGTGKPVVEKKRKTSKINLWSKTSFFNINKFKITNFFVEQEEESKRSNSTDSGVNKKRKKKVVSRIRDTSVLVPEEEDLEIKQTLLDFLIHIIHLILITTIAVSMVSSSMYYLTNITASLFFDTRNVPVPDTAPEAEDTDTSMEEPKRTLRESNTVEDFWAFAESTLVDMLYSTFFNSESDPTDNPDKSGKNMFYENQILGVARLRQVRVKSDSCQIHPSVKKFFDSCYYYYSVFSEETKPIKAGMEGNPTATAWVYSEAKSLGTSYYWGEISVYGGGGYYLDLATNKKDALEMIRELKENLWVSKATRAVFIDFNLYNANTNLFCISKIVLEFPPVGGMIPKADFHSLKLIRYLSVFDFFILACEILCLLFVVYCTCKLFKTMGAQRLSFFTSFWNYLDILMLALSYVSILLTVFRMVYANWLIYTLNDRYNKYTEFRLVKEIQINYNNITAVLLFLCWIKLLKYFNFSKKMLQFSKTLAKSLKDILWFLPMFLIVLLAFAILGNLFFGNQVRAFNTVWISFVTLLLTFLGIFNANAVVESNRILGTFFITAYIFFIFFMLMNVFVAIVVNAYTSVKSRVTLDTSRTGEYLRRGFINLVTCCRFSTKRKWDVKNVKKKFLFQEIEKALKKAGFTAAEIKIFFYKYNINCSNFLNESTKARIMDDLELRRVDFNDTSEQAQINFLRKKVDLLRERMEDLEVNLVPVIDKVDILLQRF